MNLPPDEQPFLRDLVKGARQKPHAVNWQDRDGSARVTTLTASDWSRLSRLAHHLRVAPAEVLRLAAHIPVTHAPDPAIPPGPAEHPPT